MSIYLDNAATTALDKESQNCLIKTYNENYGNPSSLHKMGSDAEKIYKKSMLKACKLINSKASSFIITSGGTESNNTGIWQIKRFKNNKKKILTNKLEHPSVLKYCNFLRDKGNIIYEYFDINKDGSINLEDLINKTDKNTGLVTIPFVNSEVGLIQDVEEISNEIKKINKDILIHVDGVQGFGKLNIDVSKLNIDTMSFSSHKIHGPKGIGGLYIKDPDKFIPLIYGGGQQNNLRSGTEDIPSIAAFGKTCEIANRDLDENYLKAKYINKKYRTLLKENIDDIIFNGDEKNTSPYIMSLSIKDIKSEVLIHFLEMDDIYISSGSACSSNHKGISKTYEALNIPKDFVDGTIRISFGRYSKEEDIGFVIEKLSKYIKEIRKMIRS
ncbi:MAG: cysteine desulfurase family protein [Bacillota bacterium]|nr:cysteine desulfurase family protein [Bacillota bacterium]